MEQSEGKYTEDQFLQCEEALNKILGTHKNLATPNKFEGILNLMPEKILYSDLIVFLDLVFILPETRNLSSE